MIPMKIIKIGNKVISEQSAIFFIAEIGINHNGSVDLAKKLIDMANICGVDAVKFQKRTPELCVPEEKKKVIYETPWGDIPYIEYKKKIAGTRKIEKDPSWFVTIYLF